MQDLFNLGAVAVIDVPARTVRSRGGIVTLAAVGTFTDNWFSYSRASGKFEEQTGLVIPKDGAFQSTRTNFWNNGGAADRGFLSVEAGGEITKANPAALADHIRAAAPGGNGFTIQNTGVTVKRGCGQNAGTSATSTMILSCIVRKADRSVVAGADVHIHCGAASGDWVDANNRAGATVYEPIRDGWTRISASVATNGLTTTVAQGLKLAPGLTLLVEFGQHERFITGSPGPTDPIPTDVAANTDRVRGAMIAEAFLRGGTAAGAHYKQGAIAVAMNPDRSAAQQTFGQVVMFGTEATNHGIVLSDSTDRLAWWTRIASVTIAFIDADVLGSFASHKAIGACGMWGFKNGDSEYFFAVNGKKEGIVTSATAHPALDPARFLIGGRADVSNVLSSLADARVRYVALFDKKPGRTACLKISKRMEQYAKEFYPWT
jgi:hypothetical protein